MCVLAMLHSISAAPVQRVKRAVSGPVISSDFPDPSIIKVDTTWYAFGSQSAYDNKNIHVQVATSQDFATWTLQQNVDALPSLPGWAADDGQVWAPDINELVSAPNHIATKKNIC